MFELPVFVLPVKVELELELELFELPMPEPLFMLDPPPLVFEVVEL